MSNKVYGFCDAGCRRRVPTYDEFLRSATYVSVIGSDGNFVLQPTHEYKIYSTQEATGGVYFDTIFCVVITLNDGTNSVLRLTDEGVIYDASGCFYCTIGNLVITEDTYITIDYIMAGEAGTFTYAIPDVKSVSIYVTGATEVYVYNKDAELLAKGESAYDVAVKNGFEGTEAEWLASLKGDVGGVDIVQELGNREDAAMSQKATTKIFDNITENLKFLETENLCNPDTLTIGRINADGTVNTSDSYMHTEEIEVSAGDVLTFYYVRDSGSVILASAKTVTAYGSDGAVLSTLGITDVNDYTVPEGVTSVVISFAATYVTLHRGFMLLKNYDGTPTEPIYYKKSYVATEEFLDGSVGFTALTEELRQSIDAAVAAGDSSLEIENIKKNLEFLTSENLCNPNAVGVGSMTVEGTVNPNRTSYVYTEKIGVSEGDVLTFFYYKAETGAIATAQANAVTAYDSGGNAVTDLGVTKVNNYTVPEGVHSVVVNFYLSYIDIGGFMLLKNYEGTPTSFIKYKNGYYATEEFLDGAVGFGALDKELGEAVDAAIAAGESASEFSNDVKNVTENLELQTSENLCNPNALNVGNMTVEGKVNANNTGYIHTERIDVSEGDILTSYYKTSNGGAATMQITTLTAFDSYGDAVADLGITKVTSYTVPTDVSSVVLTVGIDYISDGREIMILKNYEGTPESFIEYKGGYYATKKFLEGTVGFESLDADLGEVIENTLKESNYIDTEYINEEIERVNKETLNSEGTLNFIFSTDQHLKSNLADLHIMKEVAKVANSGRFDFLCMGGDMIQSGDTSWYRQTDDNGNVIEEESIGFVDKKPLVLSHMTEIANTLKDAKCPVFYCQGNHDVCFGAYHGARDYNAYYGYAESDENYKNPDDQSLLPQTFFRLFNNRLGESVVWDSENPLGGYFYKDFERSKIRVIVLQTQDVFNDDGSVVDTVNNTSLNPRIQQKQFSWFCNKALDFMDKGEDRANWAVVILSHVNVTLGGISGGSISNEQCVLMRGVINAFMTGGIYAATTPDGFMFPLSASVDFTEQGAVDFICSINGHVHADTAMDIGEFIDAFTGYDEPAISRPSIQVSAASGTIIKKDYSASALKDYFILPERVEGTISCECFDIFSIDRKNRKIKTIRFGAGENREIDY